jgi:hypothetical protein
LGLLAAYLIHAAGESAAPQGAPLPTNTHAIALSVRDEAALQVLAAQLAAAQVPVHAIREHDGPYAGQLMALGLPPLPRRAVARYLSSLPLLKEAPR